MTGLPASTRTTRIFPTYAIIRLTMDWWQDGIFLLPAMARVLGGTTKRLVARASLQATEEDQILTPLQMFQWADENKDGIKFFFVSDDDVQRTANKYQLEKRYSLSKTVSGTCSHHCFIPVSEGSLEMWRLSADDVCSTVLLGENQ